MYVFIHEKVFLFKKKGEILLYYHGLIVLGNKVTATLFKFDL